MRFSFGMQAIVCPRYGHLCSGAALEDGMARSGRPAEMVVIL